MSTWKFDVPMDFDSNSKKKSNITFFSKTSPFLVQTILNLTIIFGPKTGQLYKIPSKNVKK
jgi:hypothetical protein